MKKFGYFVAIMALMAAACTKQEVPAEPQTPEENNKEMVRIELKVTVAPETRATMEGKVFTFGRGDEIAVIGTNAGTSTIIYLTASSVNAGVITFTSDPVDPDVEIGDYAYYPSDLISDPDSPTSINWPGMIYCSAGVKVPMMAEIDLTNNTAEFKHLGAMLKVNLVDTPSDFSWLEFRTSANFVGTYTVNPSDMSMTLVADPANDRNWEVIQGNGDGVYYIPVPAGKYADFQLGMMKEDATTHYPDGYCKQRTATNLASAITPARKQIVNLGDFTYDVDTIDEWYAVCEMNGWDSSKKDLRFIKIDDNKYRFSGYAPKGSADAYYYFFWNNSTQYGVSNNVAGTLASGGTCKRTNDEIFSSTITWDGTQWSLADKSYSDDWYGCFANGDHDVVFKSNLDNWGDGVSLSKPSGYTNDMIWSGTVTIPDNSTYLFKVKAWNTDTNADVWYGGGSSLSVSDAHPYGTAVWSDGNDIPLVLTPGNYTFYFNIRELDFMFVRQ